jgi:hypothetical protein
MGMPKAAQLETLFLFVKTGDNGLAIPRIFLFRGSASLMVESG